jgi:pSer/pThr/pTyr-binding forkhead associated (FHA) protein
LAAEQPQNELTSTIHLGLREVSDPSKNHLDEQLALLSPEDRAVIAQIQSSAGEKAMILIARGPNKGSRFLVTAEGASVGRSATSSIFLDDITVSRSHATITKNGNSFVLKDADLLMGPTSTIFPSQNMYLFLEMSFK